MLKFISKHLSKYLEENKYVTEDQVVTKERLTKLRTELQVKIQEQEQALKMLQKFVNAVDESVDAMGAAIKKLDTAVKNATKQASAELERFDKQLQPEFVALRKADRQNAAEIKEVAKRPAGLDEFRVELNKKLIPIRKSVEEAKETAEQAQENTAAFKELYNNVVLNAKRQHRKFETVMLPDQTEPKDDN